MIPTFMSRELAKACDQCNRSHIRCDRRRPVCVACVRRKLGCSWDREPVFRTTLPYQNVETFSLRVARTKRRTLLQHEDVVWQQMLTKWLHTSHARIFFNYFVKISGVPLALATARERGLLADVLLNRISKINIERKMLLMVGFGEEDALPALYAAKEAFFHYFNPFYTLFSRHAFETLPRSWLLQLTVWRTGLQFLPDSSVNRALMDALDTQLLRATAPSQLKVSLDALQCHLLIIFGLITSRVLQRTWIFRNQILSIAYILGLHRPPPPWAPPHIQLERVLAYRILTTLDMTCVFTLGLPSQLPGIPNTTVIPPASYTAHQSFPSDICALVVSDCLAAQYIILSQTNQVLQQALENQSSTHLVADAITKAVAHLEALFRSKFSTLRHLHQHLSHLAIDQALCLLAIHYHYARVLALSFAAHLNGTCISPRPLPHLATPLITRGLISAMKLIRLISRVGPGPFCFMKVAYTSTAAHFIIRHFKAYAQHQQLRSMLHEARSHLVLAQFTNNFQYQAKSNLVLFDSLIVHHQISL